MEYKIFKITYNDGEWHSGDLPHFYYIAKSKEEVITNSKEYTKFLKRKEDFGGSLWISEFNGIQSTFEWENLDEFNVTMLVTKKA
jgi:hypothetical protein